MALTLVTGPANAEKARVVLDRLEVVIEQSPLLIVPTSADVELYRRELVERGVIFGANVLQFSQLFDQVAKRFDVLISPVGSFARRAIIESLFQTDSLLDTSHFGPRFTSAIAQLFEELAQAGVDGRRFAEAVQQLENKDDASFEVLAVCARLWEAYRSLLFSRQLRDRSWRDRELITAVARVPERWRKTPVFIYGFDDLSLLQRELVEVLAMRAEAEIMLSLPYEAGRFAFAGRATTFELLRPTVQEHIVLPAQPQHYAPAARSLFHHLERHLFEEDIATAPATKAVQIVEAVTVWEEAQGVTRWVKERLEEGVDAHEIAIVTRDRAELRAAIISSLQRENIPVNGLPSRFLRATAVGNAFLSFLRCAGHQATSADLLVWLRDSRVVRERALVDRFELVLRRSNIQDAVTARKLWEERHWKLDALDRLEQAAAVGGSQLIETLLAAVDRLAPATQGSNIQERISWGEVEAALAYKAISNALNELAQLDNLQLTLDLSTIIRLLEGVQVELSSQLQQRAVMLVDPLDLRARRVRALALVGMRDGVFPALGGYDGLLSPALRGRLAQEAGLALPQRDDRLGSERYLFYALVSRPTDSLFLSWHTATVEGSQGSRSIFIDDLLDCVDLPIEHLSSAQSTVPAGMSEPPSLVESSAVFAQSMGEKQRWSASELEALVACPVRWWIERRLRLHDLEPEPEPLTRGSVAHSILERVFRALEIKTADDLTAPDFWQRVHELLGTELDWHPLVFADPARGLIAQKRLANDLLRVLQRTFRTETDFVPTYFELSFGREGDPYPPLILRDDVALVGRIDRVDVGPNQTAIVYDYKGQRVVESARWQRDGILQMPLYMLAVRELLGLNVCGGFYQPLAGGELRPRGVLLADVDPHRDVVKTDRVNEDRLTTLIDESVEQTLTVIDGVRAGHLQPAPESCGTAGNCCYPAVCYSR